jgi:hypothetical protein
VELQDRTAATELLAVESKKGRKENVDLSKDLFENMYNS